MVIMSLKYAAKNVLSLNSPVLQLVAGAVMISFSSIFVTLSSAGPTADGVYRMLIGGLVLWFLAKLRGEKFWQSWPIFALQLAAGLFISVDMFLWHKSILYIGPGLATIIVNFQVFFMILAGMFLFNERPKLVFIVAILLAMLGLLLLVGPGWEQLSAQYRTGVYIALLAALFYTFYIIFLRQSQVIASALPAISNLGTVTMISCLMLVSLGILAGESLVVPQATDWLWLILYGVISQVFGWLLISKGLPHLAVTLAGLIILLQPGLAFIWDILFFHRSTGLHDLFGVTISLAGIYLGFVSNVRTKSGS